MKKIFREKCAKDFNGARRVGGVVEVLIPPHVVSNTSYFHSLVSEEFML